MKEEGGMGDEDKDDKTVTEQENRGKWCQGKERKGKMRGENMSRRRGEQLRLKHFIWGK